MPDHAAIVPVGRVMRHPDGVRAVVYEAFGAQPAVREVSEPVCPPDGAIVSVSATGLCRSDWHGWRGDDPDIVLPHVPGHEFAGVLVKVGAEVTGWQVGQRVTAPFVNACGTCDQCREGNQQVCSDQTQPGFTHWGSFAERVCVRHAAVNLVALPDGIDAVTGAALGCRFATAYRAVRERSGIRPDEWLMVFGCGGVGLSAVMIAAEHGVRVIAVDPDGAAVALARDLGAEHSLVAGDPGLARTVRALTRGGAHASIDAIGAPRVLADALTCLRPRGRHVQVGLLTDARPAVDMSTVLARELDVVGSHGMAAHQYPSMLAAIGAGRLSPGRLVSRVIELEQAGAALMAMGDAIGAGTTVIAMDGG